MKSRLTIGLALSMILLFTKAFAQTNERAVERIENEAPESHLSLVLNATNSTIYLEALTSASPGYRKNHSGYSHFGGILNWWFTKICKFFQITCSIKGIGVQRK